MDERQRTGLLLAAAAALTVTGCATTDAGPATAAPTAGVGSDAGDVVSTNGASSMTFGARPVELSLAGVDPCALLTAAQQAQLRLRPGHRIANDPKFNGASCDFQLADGATVSYFDVITVTDHGIEAWLDPTLYDNLTSVTVGGFPGLRIAPKGPGVVECTNAVSVADGQMLMVTFAFVPAPSTQDQACERTDLVATAAVATLRATK